ncbi:MAG: hypothetical protein AAF492_31420, partial [Verrucomicrobiota bacterium]
DAGVGFSGEINLKPITGKLPYVGPALRALNKTKAFQLFGDMDARVDLITTRTWRSLFPSEPTSSVPDTYTPRKHFLGGREDITPAPVPGNQFDLAFNFGMGVRASMANDRLGARGGLRLAGDEHPRTGRPSLVLSLNPDGDWPDIKQVSGKALAEMTAHLDAWITRFEKSWEWELADFTVELNTAAPFELVPTSITDNEESPATASMATFAGGTGPVILQDLYPLSSVAVAGSGALGYTDPDGLGGMALRLLGTSPGSPFAAPITIATAPGMVAADLIEMPTGGFMAVWSEIALADLNHLFPTSTVKYAVSDASGTIWGPAMVLAGFEGVVFQLKLVTSGPFLGLFLLETEGGPLSVAS